MFQYAAGRALSLERNASFHLDIAGFNGYELHHGFELSRVFVCPVEIASKTEICDILGWQNLPGIKRVLARPSMDIFRRNGFVVEPHYHFWLDLKHIPKACYLYGYWQSERYFKAFEPVIRQDFIFKEPLDERNAELALEISNTPSVSLHVRRGDYVNDPKNSNVMDVCSLEYYREAINHIAKRIEHPVFYIFSDDISWVKKHLSMAFPCVYIDHNDGLESYKDMQLMSLCQHHVIANSSFSWWGAWLNPDPEKIVVAPKHWFRNGNNDSDLIPDAWVRL